MNTIDLIQPGDLVFDVGAHAGNKTAQYLERGARVICIEPQPWRAAALRERFKKDVTVEEVALGAVIATLPMLICEQADTISTLEPAWKTGRFWGFGWNKTIDVQVETLDRMLEKHGVPAYCKIDVEGYEPVVLEGLHKTVPLISVEFTLEFPDATRAAIAHLLRIGLTRFNFGVGESDKLHLEQWIDHEHVFLEAWKHSWGDIYARAVTP